NGSYYSTLTGDGGLATSAYLNSPTFLAADLSGNLWIAETNTNRLRKIIAVPTANPVPTVVSLSPGAAAVGASGLILTVYGANFVPGAVVRWFGASRPTTFLSSSRLSTTIAATDMALPGTVDITVFNPDTGGGGGSSAVVNFLIYSSLPAVTATIN